MSFIETFGFSGDDEPEHDEDASRATWLGPPEDELGVAVQQGLVLGRSERGGVALPYVVAYSTGLSLELNAQARDLPRREAQQLFHDQHVDASNELPDGFLRLGLELADGRRVSNLGGRAARRAAYAGTEEPEGPLLLQHGGGGGTAGRSRVSMHPAYWLWPLPPPGPLRISCEWPVVGIGLTTVELDAAALVAAAARAERLWG